MIVKWVCVSLDGGEEGGVWIEWKVKAFSVFDD